MYHKISADVKHAAIRLYNHNLLDLDDILTCCHISQATFFHAFKLWRTTGDVVTETKRVAGRRRSLDFSDVQYLLRLIDRNPDYFLDEMLHLLKTNRFISVHYSVIHNQLLRTGVSRKRLQRIASECNEDARAAFIARMARYSPEELGFIDEVSKDERTVGRRYG
jgi:hypothetical protein